MADPLDQHQILLTKGVKGRHPKVVIAFHGQPRRAMAPRDYQFPRVVASVARELVDAGAIEPLVLLIPVFRFEGENWPGFELTEFMLKANQVLKPEGLELERPFVFGHSGAAGCGGEGLNQVTQVNPSAVAFLDTCLGPGFVDAVRALQQRKIPVALIHSVETAGFRPRHSPEYDARFDFGRIYRRVGLAPSPCPAVLPNVPLRAQSYRCAADAAGTTQAFVVDTGEGEPAHNAVVPVGLEYFLRRFLTRN